MLRQGTIRKLDKAQLRAEHAIDALDKLSPLKILKRGYFRITKGENTVNGVASLKVGDSICATGGDGAVTAEVKTIQIFEEK